MIYELIINISSTNYSLLLHKQKLVGHYFSSWRHLEVLSLIAPVDLAPYDALSWSVGPVCDLHENLLSHGAEFMNRLPGLVLMEKILKEIETGVCDIPVAACEDQAIK